MDHPSRRLGRVIAACGLRPIADPVRVESHSNDTWLITDEQWGRCVLRVCWIGDVQRLLREAILIRSLPDGVRVPRVLAAGTADELTWALTARLDGESLAAAWSGLGEMDRHRAVTDLSEQLRAMHAWRPDDQLLAALEAERPEPSEETTDLVGAALNPLPDALDPMIDRLASQRVPERLIARTRALFADGDRMRDELDRPASTGLTHGDLHLHNLWWDGSAVTLLDFEWARFAPAWTELARLVDNAEADAVAGRPDHTEVLVLLGKAYPELFEAPGDRLRRFRAAFCVRQAFVWPPLDEATAPGDHPVRVLRSLVF